MQPSIPPPGVGNLTVRLRDIPIEDRFAALNDALKEAKTGREAWRILSLVIDPGDYGGRIAA